MKKPVEHRIRGIKCDNPFCDFRDDTVEFEEYPGWLNRPCPLCGSNLLTQADLDATVRLLRRVNQINNSLLFRGIAFFSQLLNRPRVRFRVHMDGSGEMKREKLPEGQEFNWEDE